MPTKVQPDFVSNKENEGKREHDPSRTGDLRFSFQETRTGPED